MTIQCRTGCGEQITYEQYAFPDGFIYFLPLDLDETIHNCCNIPHNSEIDINENSMEWDESISDNYTKTQFELELGLIDDWGNNEWNLHELEKLPDEEL